MSNIVVPVLSVTIGLFFVLVGTIKLTPFLSDEFYKEMVGILIGCAGEVAVTVYYRSIMCWFG